MVGTALSSVSGRICNVCKQEALLRCSACRSSFYCCNEHQRLDWKNHRKSCIPIMVLSRGTLGRGGGGSSADRCFWVAGRDIKPGSSILKESPALRWPAWPRLNEITHEFVRVPCLTCGKFMKVGGADWFLCRTCDWPVCSVECELHPAHGGNECLAFSIQGVSFATLTRRKNLSKILDYGIALIRLSHLKMTDFSKFHTIMSLTSEPHIIQDTKLLALFHEILMHFPCFLSNPQDPRTMTYGELRMAIWILKINRFSSSKEGEFDCAGNGTDKFGMNCIYLKTSLLSRSCTPNCAQSQCPQPPDFSMVVRASVLVKFKEPLTIARQVSEAMPTFQRQKELRLRSEFICSCARCVDPTELGTFAAALACPACRNVKKEGDNIGYLLPINPLAISEQSLWECNRCSAKVPASDFNPGILELADIISEGLDNVDDYEELIRENAGVYLHPNHWILQMATSCLLEHYQDTGCPPEKIKRFTELSLYRLGIEDVVNPGMSYSRSCVQRDYLVTVWPTIESLLKEDPERTRTELSSEIELCREFIKQSHQYFHLFQWSISNGPEILDGLRDIKAWIERLTEKRESSTPQQESNIIVAA